MLLAITESGISPAIPGVAAICPICRADVIPKCGEITTWHWAHRVCDCDPWHKPESVWHLAWKKRASPNARVEVPIVRDGERHRADIVCSNGVVVELQAHFLPVNDIHAREAFYGRMVWLYRADRWRDRLHFGQRGFWWKHGSRAMTYSTKPVYWDMGDGEVWRVETSLVRRPDGTTRVLGKRISSAPAAAFEEWVAA